MSLIHWSSFMMCLSQTAGYAIQALSVVAQGGGRLWLIREIAQRSGIPRAYLAKIVNQLARKGLVAAKRGYRGGIFLKRQPEKITLLEVVEAIEGKQFMGKCMLNMDDCSTPCICPTYEIWGRMRDEITLALRRSTLAHVLGSPPGSPLAKNRKAPLKLKLPRKPAGPRGLAVLKRNAGNRHRAKRVK